MRLLVNVVGTKLAQRAAQHHLETRVKPPSNATLPAAPSSTTPSLSRHRAARNESGRGPRSDFQAKTTQNELSLLGFRKQTVVGLTTEALLVLAEIAFVYWFIKPG